MSFYFDTRKRQALLQNGTARLFALLCKSGKQKEATKIIQDEVKKRKKQEVSL